MQTIRKPSSVSVALKKAEISANQNDSLHKKPHSGFSIKLANTLEEREAAYRLAYDAYIQKGYIKPNQNGWLVKEQDADAETAVLIVLDSNKKVIGTVTMIFDGAKKIPAAEIYAEELQYLKSKNEKIVEISRLAIANDQRNTKEILILLFNYLYIYSYFVQDYTCLAIEVNPRHKDYYKSLLNFDVIGGEKACPIVAGAHAVLLNLSLHRCAAEVKKCSMGEQDKKNRSLYPQFINSDLESMAASYIAKQYKPMSEEEKIYFGFSDSTIGTLVCK